MSSHCHFEAIYNSPRLPLTEVVIRQELTDESDRRREFYQKMSDDFKMEFINGEAIFHAPRTHGHMSASGHLLVSLSCHCCEESYGEVLFGLALCVFTRNDYEPDICYFAKEKAKHFQPDTMWFPVPDFIVEVLSDSTEKRDRGVKFDDYASHGVGEYWIVDPEKQILEQYLLNQDRQFELNLRSGSGEVTSKIISGFTIAIRAIFDIEANHSARATLESEP